MVRRLTVGEHDHLAVAHLPAVTERTVKDLPAPVLAKARDVRYLIVHPGRQDHRLGANLLIAGDDDESVFVWSGAAGLRVTELNRVVSGDLASCPGIELIGRRAVEPHHAADVRVGTIALPSDVEDQGSPPRPAENERGAQTRSATADNDNLPLFARNHPRTLAEEGCLPRGRPAET